MQFTYRDPERSTDPGRILPGARSLVVGALGYLRDRPGIPAGRLSPGDRGPVLVAGRVHAAPARPRHGGGPAPRRGVAGDGGLRPERAGGQGGGPPGRPGVVRQEHAVDGGRSGLVVRARLGGHRRTADRGIHRGSGTAAAGSRRGVWLLYPVPHRLPDRCPGGPGGARRPAVPGLGGAGRGEHPLGAACGHGRPDLRVRRVPAGLPDQPPGREGASPAPAVPGDQATWTWSACWGRPTRNCWPPTAGGTSRGGSPATCVATPWWPWATPGTGPTAAPSGACAGPWPAPTGCSGARRLGRPPPGSTRPGGGRAPVGAVA